MPRPYSTDLRERAVEAVESGGSRREIAEIFKVGVSSVIRWCQRWSETGSAAPKRSGGSVSPLEEHSDWILALIAKQPDLTLEEILAVMAKQGIPGSRSALQRFFDRHNVSFKKRMARPVASDFVEYAVISLLQRIRPRAQAPAKMEIRAFRSS